MRITGSDIDKYPKEAEMAEKIVCEILYKRDYFRLPSSNEYWFLPRFESTLCTVIALLNFRFRPSSMTPTENLQKALEHAMRADASIQSTVHSKLLCAYIQEQVYCRVNDVPEKIKMRRAVISLFNESLWYVDQVVLGDPNCQSAKKRTVRWKKAKRKEIEEGLNRLRDYGRNRCVYHQFRRTTICINCCVYHEKCENAMGGDKVLRSTLYDKYLKIAKTS